MNEKNKNFSDFRNILIKNVKILEPDEENGNFYDILIENNTIKKISPGINLTETGKSKDSSPKNNKITLENSLLTIEGLGLTASPAFTDMHVHLREPGNEDKEDISSAKRAAFHGGITTVFSMPNTKPCIDRDFMVKYLLCRAAQEDFKIYPVAAMTKGLEGIDIAELGLLRSAGAVAVSDDGRCVQDAKLMYEIMKYASQLQIPLILHEEDYSFSRSGCVHDGFYSTKLGLDGISSLSEELIIARDIMLAEKSHAKIHITHVSSKKSIDLIRRAKENNINVTCDVTPHHICFNDSCLEEYDAVFKINPPIRSEEDRQAIINGLKSGVIDAIASDHAPHLELEKNTTFKEAAFGVTGLETLFCATYTELVKKENFKISELVHLINEAPRKIFGLECLRFSDKYKNKNVDIVLIDLESRRKISKSFFFSKNTNSAFIGKELYSDIICTINNGRLVYLNDCYR